MKNYIPKSLIKFNLPFLQNFKFEDLKFSQIKEIENKSSIFIKTFNSKTINEFNNLELMEILQYLYNLPPFSTIKDELGFNGIFKIANIISLENLNEDDYLFKIGKVQQIIFVGEKKVNNYILIKGVMGLLDNNQKRFQNLSIGETIGSSFETTTINSV